MSIFTRRHYVWLASAMRDALSAANESFDSCERLPVVKEVITDLASALEDESLGFHREQFFHNIYCDPTDHAFDDDCKFRKP